MVAVVETSGIPAVACCHGFEVECEDGPVGVVETPLFPPDCDEPDYLVLRVHRPGRLFPRFPVVPVSLVTGIDPVARRLRIGVGREAVEQLPEKLPLAS